MQQQVADQAAIEHRHWIRQERQKAYREVLDAYAGLSPVIWAFQESLAGGRVPDGGELSDLCASFDVLYTACSRLVLLGPQTVTAAGDDLRRALGEVEAGFRHFEAPGPTLEAREQHVASVREATASLRSQYYAFMKESRRVLLTGAE